MTSHPGRIPALRVASRDVDVSTPETAIACLGDDVRRIRIATCPVPATTVLDQHSMRALALHHLLANGAVTSLARIRYVLVAHLDHEHAPKQGRHLHIAYVFRASMKAGHAR